MNQRLSEIKPDFDMKIFSGKVVAKIELNTKPTVENINFISIFFTDGTTMEIFGNYGEGLSASFFCVEKTVEKIREKENDTRFVD